MNGVILEKLGVTNCDVCQKLANSDQSRIPDKDHREGGRPAFIDETRDHVLCLILCDRNSTMWVQ